MKAALGESNEATIRINKVRFVMDGEEQPGGEGGAGVAAALIAQTLGPQADKLRDWLGDPQKLLQLIAAAEGMSGKAAEEMPAGATAQPASEGDVLHVMQMLAQIAQANAQTAAPGAPTEATLLRQKFQEMPAPAQTSVREALAGLASNRLPAGQPQSHLLVQLAEQLAIRHALERFERGAVRIDAVREMLHRMGLEVDKLRRILGVYQERMSRAGLAVETHEEILDRQFWAQVPEASKRSLLLSPDAWCIPPRNVAFYLEQLASQEPAVASAVLKNYAACARSPEDEARRRVAPGIGELTKHYAADEEALTFAIGQLGRQIAQETIPEVRTQFQESFARLSQEAAGQRRYAAVGQVLHQMENLEDSQQALARELRTRVGLEVRLRDFIENALHLENVPAELTALLARMPQVAMDGITARFARSTRREECERLIALARETRTAGVAHLRTMLDAGPDTSAAATVGLLSRLAPDALDQAIAARLPKWNLLQQDMLVRQIAMGAAPNRGTLLLNWFPLLDPLLQPEVIDEMGITGDRSVTDFLQGIAKGGQRPFDAPYLRVKSIEALGRLREPRAIGLLRTLVEAKKMWGWEHPHELRLVAAQALAKIDPSWAKSGLAAAGISNGELSLAPPLDAELSAAWSRARRYPRLLLGLTLPAVASTERQKSNLAIKVLNLGGGLASSDTPIAGGTPASLEMRSGLRGVRAEVLVREARREQITFEVVRMNFEERAKLRKLLAGLQTVAV
jgi:pyruvate/2-oxoglutarate dehydrogenase complex dihydrolipoamide acyltransferase (E2) component/antitoxin component of RelBE/YafQ-DinJ toxin-antitoxin module